MAWRFCGRWLLLASLAACAGTDDGEMTLGTLDPAAFPSCEEPCPEPLDCSQLVNVRNVGTSPPVCLDADICARVTCDRGVCRRTDTFPVQVRCIVD